MITAKRVGLIPEISGDHQMYLVALLQLLVAVTPSDMSLSQEARAELDSFLKEHVQSGEIPGVVVMIVDRDSTLYSNALGKQDVRRNIEMKTDSIFRIASMTKPVSTVGVLKLIEKGELTLDTALHEILPEYEKRSVIANFDLDSGVYDLRTSSSPITIRQLLTHTSGFAVSFTDQTTLIMQKKERKGAEKLPLIADPGTEWHYGVSTNILGKVMEKISGKSLPDYLDSVVFVPLGMEDTTFKVPDERLDRLVTYHRRNDNGLVENPNPEEDPGSTSAGGGLRSTAEDYCKFLRQFLPGATESDLVLERTLRLEMTKNQIGPLFVATQPMVQPNLALPFPLGAGTDKFSFGFQIKAADNHRQERSVGSLSWGGIFNTHFWVDPHKEVAVVVLMQVLPYYDEHCIELLRGVETLLYRHLH